MENICAIGWLLKPLAQSKVSLSMREFAPSVAPRYRPKAPLLHKVIPLDRDHESQRRP